MLGGGYADIPLIQAAKKFGYVVITTGNRDADLGHQYSDEYVFGDFSNKDQMLEIARKYQIDAVCACCNDFAAISAAYIAEFMGLPGHDSYETTLLIHHKDRFREFVQKHNISSPCAISFTDVDDATKALQKLKFPLIVKPVDLTGGKGISVIYNATDARTALINAFQISRAKRVVVEEFIQGTRHGLSMLINEGKVVYSFADDEHYYKNPYMVYGTTFPSTVASNIIQQLHNESEKIAALLQLKAGILHMQFIVSVDTPYIIEICRRAPGDLYPKFVEYSTGIDYSACIVQAEALGRLGSIDVNHEPRFTARFCIMAPRNGVLRNVHISEEIKNNIVDKFLWWKSGDEITDYLTAKLGIVFLNFSSQCEMNAKIASLERLIQVEII